MTHHSIAAHAAGAGLLTCPATVWAVLAGQAPLLVLAAVTLGAAALGWAVEVSQRRMGWGMYSRRDIAVTTLGGVVGWALAMGAIHV